MVDDGVVRPESALDCWLLDDAGARMFWGSVADDGVVRAPSVFVPLDVGAGFYKQYYLTC